MSELTERLRKMAVCIHIAVEKIVADDVADGLTKAADEIERLTSLCEALGHKELKAADEIERLREQLHWAIARANNAEADLQGARALNEMHLRGINHET
jgi:hypothetical protein